MVRVVELVVVMVNFGEDEVLMVMGISGIEEKEVGFGGDGSGEGKKGGRGCGGGG